MVGCTGEVPRGAIFDCDGTLMDTMGLWTAMEDELAARAGHRLSEEEVAALRTYTLEESAAFFHDRLGLGASRREVTELIVERLAHHYATRAKLRDGALEFVRRLAEAGVPCAVASSSPHSMLDPGLACTGLAPYIRAVVSTDDVGSSKRTPAAYDRALELIGTPRGATWVFEDAIYALRTARGAGYRTVGMWDRDDSGTFEELSGVADVAVRGWDELDAERFLRDGTPSRARPPIGGERFSKSKGEVGAVSGR